MPFKEKETVKLYYSIGEVAKIFNVNTSLIRFWEKEFDQLNPKVKPSGIRKFTKDDIENISTIYSLLKEEGLTIQGAKKRLKSKEYTLLNYWLHLFLRKTDR